MRHARETAGCLVLPVVGRRDPKRDLRPIDLSSAHLIRANLSFANLYSADLTGANLTGADLSNAKLTGAFLSATNLTDARWSEDTPVPEGWKLDNAYGRLTHAGTDSGPAKANLPSYRAIPRWGLAARAAPECARGVCRPGLLAYPGQLGACGDDFALSALSAAAQFALYVVQDQDQHHSAATAPKDHER